ncbi:AraC family transcriptional regulator [Noviherbaspirillum sedimenti]|nr:AraC family transcriptional regulator [Noviherbaspirillum sedimenti]
MKTHKTTVSEILQHVRVTELECSLIEVAAGRGAMFVAMRPTFHFVLDGRCHLSAEDVSINAVLEAGDFIVVPHGRRHSLSDSPEVKAVPAREAERVPLALERDVPVLLRFCAGETPAFRILSGVFRFPPLTTNPIVSALPPLLSYKRKDRQVVTLGAALKASLMAPGGRTLVLRLAELMLLEVVRGDPALMERVAHLGPVWLRTFRIEQAVAAVTANPAHPWTLALLAKHVGMSRANFAEKYVARLGLPPMQHVAAIRLDHAAVLLRSTTLPIGEIARQSGYASESSFARVFRTRHGIPPKEYRKAAWIQPMS